MQYILAEALSSHCDNCPPCLSGRPPPPRRRRAAPFVTPRPRAPGSAPAQRLPAPRRRGGGGSCAPRGRRVWPRVWGESAGYGLSGCYGGQGFGVGRRGGGGGGLVTCRSCAGEGPAGKQAQPRERAGVPETRPAPPPQRVSSPQRRGRAAFRRDSRCSRASLAAAQPSLRRRAPLSPRAAAAWLSFLSSTVTGRG